MTDSSSGVELPIWFRIVDAAAGAFLISLRRFVCHDVPNVIMNEDSSGM